MAISNNKHMRKINKIIIFCVFIIITFFVESCLLNEEKSILHDKKDNDYTNIVVINDSIILLNKKECKITELNSRLNKIRKKSLQNKNVKILSDSNVKMHTIKKIESILAYNTVKSIIYVQDEDSVSLHLITSYFNKIILMLEKNGNLILERSEVKNEQEFVDSLKLFIESSENPVIVLTALEGTNYQLYLEEKERIQKIINQFDLKIKLSEEANDFYKIEK